MTKKYGNAIVMFDGYDDMSTKNMTHQRRAAGKAGATVTFTENMKVTLKKDNFLANPKNKQRFINMLSRFLQEDNCPTYRAEGDADVLIVKTAVESARERNTVLVGDDTDLLVLLCFYTRSDSFDLYFKPEPKANSRRHHSPRVYPQVKQWKGENEGISLEEYGWKVTEGQVLPRITDLPAASELLLQMIRCHCSSDCASARCTCRKHGLECSPACGHCRGTACTNSPIHAV